MLTSPIFIISIVFMLLGMLVSGVLKRKFAKYSKIPSANGMSGAEVAQRMLDENGIHDVRIGCVPGRLSDHYNPMDKTVNLSPEVYEGRNAAAFAVASHECGHAVQHARGYAPLKFRSALVPIQNVSGKVLNIVVMVSIFGGAFLYQTFPIDLVLIVIIGCYGVLTLFSLVTLPVEFDASARALHWMEERRVVTSQEHEMAKDALKWAAMTYVVAALASLVTLLYYLSLLLGRSRD